MPDFIALREIAAQPYAERQLIVVLPDRVVDAARAAELKASRQSMPVDWKKLTVVALNTMTSSFAVVAVALVEEAVKAWARARESGIPIQQVSRTEATALRFPPGHPRDGVLYVGHPALPEVYYTIASFHRMAFEHKFSEAIELLMSLGANEIRVEHVRGWSREFAGSASLALPLGESINASQDGKMSAKASLLYEATLSGSSTPLLPSGLVWYPHEPTWQAVAKGRLSFGLAQFSLTVNYEDDFGVNAGLKASAQKAGLELGGNFEDHEATTWTLHGKFKADG